MMYPDSLKNEPSKRIPRILLEPGRIFMMGRSIPDNPGDIFKPVHEWIKRYSADYTGETRIDMGFEYINTSSTKWIFALLKELAMMNELGKAVYITWYYEQGDDDMLDLGYILRSLIDCPFTLLEVETMNDETYEKIRSGTV
jgi:hypothetical protein